MPRLRLTARQIEEIIRRVTERTRGRPETEVAAALREALMGVEPPIREFGVLRPLTYPERLRGIRRLPLLEARQLYFEAPTAWAPVPPRRAPVEVLRRGGPAGWEYFAAADVTVASPSVQRVISKLLPVLPDVPPAEISRAVLQGFEVYRQTAGAHRAILGDMWRRVAERVPAAVRRDLNPRETFAYFYALDRLAPLRAPSAAPMAQVRELARYAPRRIAEKPLSEYLREMLE